MEKGINLRISELKDSLAEVLNNSYLPIGLMSLMIGDLYAEMKILNGQMVVKEKKEFDDGGE